MHALGGGFQLFAYGIPHNALQIRKLAALLEKFAAMLTNPYFQVGKLYFSGFNSENAQDALLAQSFVQLFGPLSAACAEPAPPPLCHMVNVVLIKLKTKRFKAQVHTVRFSTPN